MPCQLARHRRCRNIERVCSLGHVVRLGDEDKDVQITPVHADEILNNGKSIPTCFCAKEVDGHYGALNTGSPRFNISRLAQAKIEIAWIRSNTCASSSPWSRSVWM